MERLDECYTIYGTGGWESCMVIQDRLQDHGLCTCTRWAPDPTYRGDWEQEKPTHWRFFFETNLKETEALALLGSYADRYQVLIK
jgi:hypothetical protein